MIYSHSNLTSFSVVEGKSVNSSGLFLLYFTAPLLHLWLGGICLQWSESSHLFESGGEGEKRGKLCYKESPSPYGPQTKWETLVIKELHCLL